MDPYQKQIDSLDKTVNNLKEEIEGLKKTTNICPLVQIKNIIYFDEKMIDIYEKKKAIHGEDKTLHYVYCLITDKNADNKHDWLLDQEIIDSSKNIYPLKLISSKNSNGGLQIKVLIDKDKSIIDNGTQIDKIGNAVITDCLLKAQNEWGDSPITPLYKRGYNNSDKKGGYGGIPPK